MNLFRKPKAPETRVTRRLRKREIPQGLWTKCPVCGEVLFNKELEKNWQVCPKCQHHMTLDPEQRVAMVVDEGSFLESDRGLTSVDVLNFTGVTSYINRIEVYQKKTGRMDAVYAGMAKIGGHEVSVAVMDFGFLGGSMGSVVGEKITRAIERGIERRCAVVVICASGGARMYEGMLSLMQMAKTSAALSRLSRAKLPYISVLTNPTMAGVMASFASLGDVIIAEPKAMIGFAGARVIKETTQQELPKGFQTSEFLLERGLIDAIVHRHEMREMLAKLLGYMSPKKVS